jgi:hypothetical protein
MNKRSHTQLAEELKAAGASASETRELAAVAGSLKQLKGHEPAAAGRRSGTLRTLMPYGFTSLAGIAAGMTLVILSQTVLPGSWLYPVQKLSDNIAVSVHPDYRGTIMMKRAQEVRQLIAGHAAPNVVLAALSDYKNEAYVYKSAPANYAAFEYCKANLQQAAAIAPNSERQAIENTLSSLNNV